MRRASHILFLICFFFLSAANVFARAGGGGGSGSSGEGNDWFSMVLDAVLFFGYPYNFIIAGAVLLIWIIAKLRRRK